MTFKSKEQLFGDGGANGPMVPVSTSNAPGTSSNNRGVAFGEQLTSAISNRTPYALAVNDEDLDSRLATWESDGLDAAYRQGAAAVAGGGRIITLDGGAVETESAQTSEYGDDDSNAHFRADATSDTIYGTQGFEFKGSIADPTATTSGTGGAGFQDRRVLAFGPTGVASYFLAAESVTLNPSGSGATIVELDTAGRKFWTSAAGPTPPAGSYTCLLPGMDLIQISGTSSNDGLYIVYQLGAAENQILVRTLSGNSPVFSVDAAGTATLFRSNLASYGSSYTRSVLTGPAMVPSVGADAALTLGTGDGDAVAADALRTEFGTGGTVTPGGKLSQFGQFRFGVLSEDLPYLYSGSPSNQRRFEGGAFASRVEREGSSGGAAEFGHLVTGGDTTVRGRLDFASAVPLNVDGYSPSVGLDLSIAFDYGATSPSAGLLSFQASEVSGSWYLYLVQLGMAVEILSGDSRGFYILTATDSSGDGSINVANLDGTAPSHFPTSGSATLRFHALSSLGFLPSMAVANPLLSNPSTMAAYNRMVSGPEEDSSALTLFTSRSVDAGDGKMALRAFTALGGTGALETFSVDPLGNVKAYNGYTSSLGEFNYGALRTGRIMPVSLTGGLSVTTGWAFSGIPLGSNFFWTSSVDSAQLVFNLTAALREGMVLTGCKVVIDPGAARAGASRSQIVLSYATHSDFAASPSLPSVTTVSSQFADTTTNLQTITISSISHTVVREGSSGREYFLLINAGNDGGSHNADKVYAIELTYSDIGPRNY